MFCNGEAPPLHSSVPTRENHLKVFYVAFSFPPLFLYLLLQLNKTL